MPKTISLITEASSVASSAELTILGLEPNAVYYKYEDSYKNEIVVLAAENGNHSWTQDTTQAHHIWFQPSSGTIFLPANCSTYGIWDAMTKTCTLNRDITQSAEITENNFTLDCNNRTITGVHMGYGIYINRKDGTVVKNCTVKNFSTGIYLLFSASNAIFSNIIEGNDGIGVLSSNMSLHNTINANVFTDNFMGMQLSDSGSNLVTDNIFMANHYGLMLSSPNNILRNNTLNNNEFNFGAYSPNDVDTNNTINGKPIYFLLNLYNQVISPATGYADAGYIGVADSSNVTVENFVIEHNLQGIALVNSTNSVIKDIRASSNSEGISLWGSIENDVVHNILTNNGFMGVRLQNASNENDLRGNIISGSDRGVFIAFSDHNILADNTITQITGYLPAGLYLWNANQNKTFHNNLIDNVRQIYIQDAFGNLFDSNLPDGGNYWSDYDTPAEGCTDTNNDKMCDVPYTFTGGQDWYPWTERDGWKIQANQPPTLSSLDQHKSDGLTTIIEGQTTTEPTIVFKATLNDPDNDQVKLQIELKEFNQPFDETSLIESDFVPSGQQATVTRYGLVDGEYHWRARVADARGAVSDWQEFGVVGNVDFEVSLSLSTKAAWLSKELVNAAYLYGGKGWDYNLSQFVASNTVKTGYTFWNQEIGSLDFDAGVDCSGLIMWAYDRSFDPNKPRFENFVKAEGADEQYRYNTTSITEPELQPGDVMFFDFDDNNFIDHVVMYVGESGGFDVINAARPSIGIIPDSKDRLKNTDGFVAFKRVISALPPSVLVSAGSPVDLTVTDPDGFTITSDIIIPSDLEFLRQIPGELYYSEMEQGTGGRPIDQVYSYTKKTGDYLINVIPESDALPTDTFSLSFTTDFATTTILAEDVPVSEIPTEPYIIRSSEEGEIEKIIPAKIKIEPETLNISSKGVFTAFIQIEKGFGASIYDINPETITISKAKAVKTTIDEENGTLIAKFNRQDLVGVATGDEVKLLLRGELFDGTVFEGSDTLKVTNPKAINTASLFNLPATVYSMIKQAFSAVWNFLVDKLSLSTNQVDEDTTPSIQPSATTLTLPPITLGLKTYRNTEWGFEFRYPEQWTLHTNTFNSPFSEFNLIGTAPEEKEPNTTMPSLLVNIVTPDFADRAASGFKNLNADTTAITVGGAPGLRYEYSFANVPQIDIELPFGQYRIFLGARKEHEGVFNQIVSNFEFFGKAAWLPTFYIRAIDVALAMIVSSQGPVDLIVTDPDGFTITPDTIVPSDLEYLREIPGILYYSEMEKGLDGNPIDRVYSPLVKTGDYTIKVIPGENFSSGSKYWLNFSFGKHLLILSDGAPVSQISSQVYRVHVKEDYSIELLSN
ncbi:MAG: hypothetical protein A3D59_03325 [Candidatus Wildermuthbacteria bacterium RIFCSPHIGHO2_02_FULL_47_17]|uniref:NlpC/P60 domain-containing protein n=1 Tax=Candidatus Wildermuthbacteria bacterium RIFCSPHIGHO2_02_FULL_47_17 TaxID=1802452 RepID=A0A1G2R678_9BACT|nr:MAG: hypothetical protein A3D59_03325 [Candidatus Wildermuthbacteria bacterium RIFCSPHIGHO2_02_FULL_47_17]